MTQLTFWSLESVPARGDNAGEMSKTRRLGKGLRALLPVAASDDDAPARFDGFDRDADSVLRLSDAEEEAAPAVEARPAPPPAVELEAAASAATPVPDAEPSLEPAAAPQTAPVQAERPVERVADPPPSAEPPRATDELEVAVADEYVFFDDVVLVGASHAVPEPVAPSAPPEPVEAAPTVDDQADDEPDAAPEAGESRTDASAPDEPPPPPEPEQATSAEAAPQVVLHDDPILIDDVVTGFFLPDVELE